ncbi:MAG: TAXI family TRAP transporter solute-binding subunit [Desulfovibrionaceae bacterium]|nr:TAXI family TRAP transporter solute-binding subunit [Desulfovibrionaceae bacterium]
MRRTVPLAPIIVLGLWSVFLAACSSDGDRDRAGNERPRETVSLVFNGGPSGGTFNYFANKMSFLITNGVKWLDVMARGSQGSPDNICALNLDQADMAILYAGDAFLGLNGRLECQAGRLDRVRSLAFLYGAPAQLVVRADSDIHSVFDLKGKIVAVGNAGSGAALAAERLFRHLGLWDQVDHRNLGYSRAAADFGAGRVDAFWVLVGYPNTSVIEASTLAPIRLIDLHGACVDFGFYDLYPFYGCTVIPAGTYDGQAEPVATFQDAAIWCASRELDEEAVYRSLQAIYSPEGLESMRAAHKAAWSMSLESGILNLSVPMHPGAVRFWSEAGREIPTILLPN